MKAIVDKAAADVAALPPAEHGKSGEHSKPDATTQEHGKPAERPGGKPSSAPGRP